MGGVTTQTPNKLLNKPSCSRRILAREGNDGPGQETLSGRGVAFMCPCGCDYGSECMYDPRSWLLLKPSPRRKPKE